MYISKSFFLLKNHSIYMITCSLVVILYHHDRSLLAVTHCQTRISSNFHTVNTELPKCSKK